MGKLATQQNIQPWGANATLKLALVGWILQYLGQKKQFCYNNVI